MDMTARRWNMSRGTLFVVLVLAGAVLLLVPEDYTQVFPETFRRTFSVLLNIHPGRSEAPPLPKAPTNGQGVAQAEYERLYTAYQNTYAQLLEMQRRLSTLQKIQAALPVAGSPLLLASVTNVLLSPEELGLLVQPTSRIELLRPGQYVLGRDSVIGSIAAVYRTTARVRLVTDAQHRMLVAIARPGRKTLIRAQMEGVGDGTARIVNLSRKEHDVRPGDTVYAAARPGYLATEVLIGEVATVQADPDHPLLWDIRVRPICQPETLRDVAVVVMETPASVNGD
jgi:cell shape-determining protein MreC